MKILRQTAKGQVTLPRELRDPARATIMDWAGTLRSPQPGISEAKIRRRVKKAVAGRIGLSLSVIEAH